MGSKNKFRNLWIFISALAVIFTLLVHGHTVSVLQPAGPIAHNERSLIIVGVLLSLIIVVPVFGLTIYITRKYREENQATYQPDWDHSRVYETIWWLVPTALIAVFSILNWNSSHQLDPYKTISSTTKPLTVQVVALQWKWLFLYPEQHVASVNLLHIPDRTPVNLQITADAPMNSFWVPQLAGQIYAMPGMSTQLHLLASHAGDFRGSSANISGQGFADMHFVVKASTQSSFMSWVKNTQQSQLRLTATSYSALARPAVATGYASYNLSEPNLYSDILMKYMMPNTHFGDTIYSTEKVTL